MLIRRPAVIRRGAANPPVPARMNAPAETPQEHGGDWQEAPDEGVYMHLVSAPVFTGSGNRDPKGMVGFVLSPMLTYLYSSFRVLPFACQDRRSGFHPPTVFGRTKILFFSGKAPAVSADVPGIFHEFLVFAQVQRDRTGAVEETEVFFVVRMRHSCFSHFTPPSL